MIFPAFVIPLGATINMDGTAIYQCVATIFLATCCGMTLTLGQMVTIVVTATLASIGTAGTSGAGMIMLAMVLQAIEHPRRYDHASSTAWTVCSTWAAPA